MKLTLLLILSGIILTATAAQEAHAGYVKGYYRKDGTYVKPHYRADADDSKLNNRACTASNPYAGRVGEVLPYRPKLRTISL